MGNRLFEALRRVQESLKVLDVSWALVGGLAFSARIEPRTTRDVDVAVAVDSDEAAERIVFSLGSASYRIIDHGHLEHVLQDRLSTTRLEGPDPGIVIDLLFASSGIEREIVSGAETIELVPSLRVPIASVGHLLATKILAHRARDIADIEEIAAIATPEDLRVARHGLELIETRGFNRGRDLQKILQRYVPS